MKVVIRAGGVGTRLWPLSRQSKPKQFHAFAGGRTLIQEAYDRVGKFYPSDDIYVSAPESIAGMVREQLPSVPAENLILEPARRDTAAAIGLETAIIARKDPRAVIASLGSDHVIRDADRFINLLKAAETAIETMPDYLFALGVKPTRPETGFGYIETDQVLMKANGEPVYRVTRFTEKPDLESAEGYVRSGHFLWNSNMFIWRADTLLNLFRKFEPEMMSGLREIQSALGSPQGADVLRRVYPTLKRVAVDYAIIEKTDKMAVIPADMGWADIGSWSAIHEVAEPDARGNIAHGREIILDTSNSTIFSNSGRLVAVLGMKDVVVVDTGDTVLVCSKQSCQDVKKLTDALSADGELKRFAE
ncbi:MAG TPA: mannose-1-phosphate guanylyltransferase [Candidatus Brocadiia bacterium]|nr:mannose-1-phosphate guanylyltransferase [Candidatus Brocadiia bacterium]